MTRGAKLATLAAAALATLIVGFGLALVLIPDAGVIATGQAPIGGPFALVDDTGKPRRDEDFRGKLMLVYFGYTQCPDACPTTLQALANALDQLGPRAAEVATLFITIDPERDTVDKLKGYAEQFRPDFLGLTGTPEAIAKVAAGYKVYYRKAGAGPDYLMDHSTIIYLMDRQGRFVTNLAADAPPARMAETIAKYF